MAQLEKLTWCKEEPTLCNEDPVQPKKKHKAQWKVRGQDNPHMSEFGLFFSPLCICGERVNSGLSSQPNETSRELVRVRAIVHGVTKELDMT